MNNSALTSRGSTAKWRRIRAAILQRDRNVCQATRGGRICGAYANTVGHIIRRECGGNDAFDNLRAECGPCNYGERSPHPTVVDHPSQTQLDIARALDMVGLPVSAGRRQAVPVLAKAYPFNRFRSDDIDTACRYRRQRGSLLRA